MNVYTYVYTSKRLFFLTSNKFREKKIKMLKMSRLGWVLNKMVLYKSSLNMQNLKQQSQIF